MKHFSKKQLKQARKTNLYDFLIRYYAGDFRREGNSIHPIDNDSISIKQGYCGYMDFATAEKGNSVDFLIKYLGYQLDDAVFALCGESGSFVRYSYDRQEPKLEKLPAQFPVPIDTSYKQLYAYLMSRGISPSTIKMLIDLKILYQDIHNNIIFANKERNWGERRGTNTYADSRCVYRMKCLDFKEGVHGWCTSMESCKRYKKDAYRGMIANSREDGFWWFQIGDKKSDKVYICESSIDAISLY